MYNKGFEVISCPTCSRTKIDIIKITKEVESKFDCIDSNKLIKVAIMGYAVNGPGEASDADIGITGGNKEAFLFKKGKIIKKFDENDIINILLNSINEIIKEELYE